MAALRKFLRYEFRLSVRVVLAIVVIVVAVNAIWPHAPSWPGFLVGAAVALAEGWLERRELRRAARP